MTSEQPAAGSVDGRTARAERSKAAIVSAHLQLIESGDLSPTGERIAERAGISLRTLWTNFRDLEALFAATGAVVLEREEAQSQPVDLALPLTERIDRFCAHRAAALETLAPAAAAARLRTPFSKQLQHNRSRHIDLARRGVEQAFAPELEAGGTTATSLREALVVAMTTATTSGDWQMLRQDFDLDETAARRVMTGTVTALLVRWLGQASP
ncbi:TetR/AcrR family transcriptional regulator [Angustibacter luteus]|uniref:TetR/AcrR family transcriptional regulator n=1 Tax=Angustibacter luteus TaxID=658456 RepID=A0ABW1JIA5_9ACTN